VLSTVYGTGGVIYILLKAIKRVLPIALEPFQKSAVPLSQFQLGYVDFRFVTIISGHLGRTLTILTHSSNFVNPRPTALTL
jgi:hypothetical protein